MRLLENLKFPNLQSGEKYASLEALMSGPAEWLGSGARVPSPFEKGCYREKGRKRQQKISDLPMLPMRNQNKLI